MAKYSTQYVNGVPVQTSDTAASRNRKGLANQKDIAEWQIQADLAEEANRVNLQMNAENNQLQMDLANLAYERSTPQNQYRELIKAGFTEQQAKLALLGNLSPTSQPVASTEAGHVDFPQLSAPTPSDNSLASSALSGALGLSGDLFSILGNSLMAQDGGPLGWSLAADYMKELTDLVDNGYISSDDMCLPADLVMLGRSMQDGDAKDAVLKVAHGNSAYRVASQPLAMRGAQAWLRNNFGFKTEAQHIKESVARTMQSTATTKLLGTELSLKSFQAAREELGLNRDMATQSFVIESQLAQLRETILTANRDYNAKKSTYNTYIRTAMQNADNLMALAELTEVQYQYEKKIADFTNSGLSDELSTTLGYYKACEVAGLTNLSQFGFIASSGAIAGAGVVNGATSVIDKALEFGSDAVDAVGSAATYVIDYASDAWKSLSSEAKKAAEKVVDFTNRIILERSAR